MKSFLLGPPLVMKLSRTVAAPWWPHYGSSRKELNRTSPRLTPMFSLYSVVCEAGACAMFGAAVAGVPPDDGRRGGTGVVVDAGPVDGTDAGVRQPPAARDAVVGASP